MGRIMLNPSWRPKWVAVFHDVLPARFPQRKGTQADAVLPWTGIYELDGDTLRMCLAPPGKKRATKLESREGSGLSLEVWKRVKAKDDRAKLEGTWKIVSWEEDGKAGFEEAARKAVLTVTGNRFTLRTPEETTEGSFKIDSTKKPEQIEVTSVKGRYRGKTLLGVYELRDHTCKVCFAPPGKDRPKELSAKKGSGHILLVVKRGKAKP
jgi:uncharacterized protein (TIGR03067 family)